MHAYRDAARAGRQALELWPEGEDEERRIEALEAYASSAELSGELAEAARAWREICAIRAERGDGASCAEAQRRLAAVYDLRGDREAAFAARRRGRRGVRRRRAGPPTRRSSGWRWRTTCAPARATPPRSSWPSAAGEDAERGGAARPAARALGLEGVARAKRGDFEAGLETVRDGLALALEHDLTPVAAELYQRLSLVLYDAADYRRAQETLDTALELCRDRRRARAPRWPA